MSEYRDNLGRVCSVANNAQLVPATCNKTPAPKAGCSGGFAACFVVISSPLDTGQMQNCDTCCDHENKPALPSYQDCGIVTCNRDDDCIYGNGRCVKNYCYFDVAKPAAGGTSAGGTAGSPGQGGTGTPAPVAGGPTQALGGAGTGGALTTLPGGTGGEVGGTPGSGQSGSSGSGGLTSGGSAGF